MKQIRFFLFQKRYEIRKEFLDFMKGYYQVVVLAYVEISEVNHFHNQLPGCFIMQQQYARLLNIKLVLHINCNHQVNLLNKMVNFLQIYFSVDLKKQLNYLEQ